MRLIVDVASNRVVWYTEGDETLVCTEGTALVNFSGEWPPDITQQTCWNWVLRDRRIVPHETPPPESLYQSNLIQTERLLRRKIDEKRKQITSGMLFEEFIQSRKIATAREYLDRKVSSWLLTRLAAIWGIGLSEAAQRILDEWTARERMLLQTEAQLTDFLHRLGLTKTSDEVLAIHGEIVRL